MALLLNAFSQGSGTRLNDISYTRLTGRLDTLSCKLVEWSPGVAAFVVDVIFAAIVAQPVIEQFAARVAVTLWQHSR